MATFTTGDVLFQRVNIINAQKGTFNIIGNPVIGTVTEVGGDDAAETQVFTDQFGIPPTTPPPLRQFLAGDSDPTDTGAANDEFITINGVNYNYRYLGELEIDVDQQGGTNTFAFVEVIGLPDGNNLNSIFATNLDDQTTPANGRTTGNFNDLQPGEIIICFAAGTLVTMETDAKPVEEIRIGDRVVTLEGKAKTVRWVGSSRIHFDGLKKQEHLRPVRITAGALGTNCPNQDLVVSAQHRILVCSKVVERMFGQPEVLVKAKDLLSLNGVSWLVTATSIEYFHILLDDHQVIVANGTPTETLFRGEQTLKVLSSMERLEIEAMFPNGSIQSEAELSRMCPKGRQARKLIERHVKNVKPVINNETRDKISKLSSFYERT